MKTSIASKIVLSLFKNRYLLVLSLVLCFVAGISASLGIPLLEDPRIVNRNPIVLTSFPGASPERVDSLVTEKLEDALDEIAEIKHLRSTSRAGISSIAIELEDNVTADENTEIFSRIRDRIATAEGQLPAGAGKPFVDDKRDPAAFTFLIGLTWNSDSEIQLPILSRHAEALADKFRSVAGTELVRIYGDIEEEILVEVDSSKLNSLGLTTSSISQALSRADSKLPSGVLNAPSVNLPLEVDGSFSAVERIASIPVQTGNNQEVVRLDDIAKVAKGYRQPVDEIALVNDSRAIYVGARMKPDARVDSWTNTINASLSEYQSFVGNTIGFEVVFEQNKYTSERLWSLVGNLVAGALVIVLIIFLLMGFRLAIIVGLALPLVTALTIFTIFFTGGSLQQMSIFGMIIALGLLIDNAIVIVDEISARRDNGESSSQALVGSVEHLFLPLLASTLTTILAFTPILLLPGGAGDFVGPIAQSVIYAIIFSFFASMSVIAALAAIFVKEKSEEKETSVWAHGYYSKKLAVRYRSLLKSLYQKPLAAILLALALPVAGFAVAANLGQEFFPAVDRDMFELQLWLPESASVEHNRSVVSRVHSELINSQDVEEVYWLVGGSFPSVFYNLVMNKDGANNYSQAIIKSSSSEATDYLVPKLQAELDSLFPEAQIVLREFGQGPPVQADVEYRVIGPSIDGLKALGEKLRQTLQEDSDVIHTQATIRGGEPKLWYKASEDKALLSEYSLSEISQSLQAKLDGLIGGSVLEDLEELPVRVRLGEGARSSLAKISSLSLSLPGENSWTPLNSLGKFELRPELSSITRYDGSRSNDIKGYTRAGALPIEVANRVLERFNNENAEQVAQGYKILLGGTVEQDKEAKGNLFTYIPLLVTGMVALLILTFKSVLIAIILGGVALSSIGLAFLSTGLAGFPISFNTILGTFGLIGIALNDSIVVVNSLVTSEGAKSGKLEAIVEEVASCTRHLLSTTLTTMGGFLPLLIIVGGDFWPALAIVLVGGIAGATIVAILFVPSAFLLMYAGRGENEGNPVLSQGFRSECFDPLPRLTSTVANEEPCLGRVDRNRLGVNGILLDGQRVCGPEGH